MLFLILFRGDWVCSLCRDVMQPEVEYDCENERTSGEHASINGLPAGDQRVGHFISCIHRNDGWWFSVTVFPSCIHNNVLSRLVMFLEM